MLDSITFLFLKIKHTLENSIVFLLVDFPHTRGGCRTDLTSDVTRPFFISVNLAGRRHESRSEIRICTHILWFLLCPHYFGFGVICNMLCHFIKRKGGYLFESNDCHIGTILFFTFRQELVKDLTCAENKCLDTLGLFIHSRINLSNDSFKLRAGPHILYSAHTPLIPQQILRCNDNQRLSKFPVHLPPQTMKVIGGSGAIHHLPIALLDLHPQIKRHLWNVMRILIHHLEESFQATTRVFGPLTVVPVREEHDQPALSHPLVLTRRNELINHNLGTVAKISKLGLPNHQRVGVFEAVPQFKADYPKFRQDGILCGEAGLGVGKLSEFVLGQ
mmetsp:Transcript_52822/g.53221  ORF Transcript_52822/g.53221 Transcript_52822/m.53221 type:complete len:332 (-) Transcript_52822:1055-2050(-)